MSNSENQSGNFRRPEDARPQQPAARYPNPYLDEHGRLRDAKRSPESGFAHPGQVPAPPPNPYQGQAPSGYPGGTGAGGHGRPDHPQSGYSQPEYSQPGYGYPSSGYAQPYAPEARTMSLVAMIAGIVGIVTGGLFLVPQILAVVFGHIGLRKEPAGRGMAIAGLVMGYLTLGLGVLFWVLFVFMGLMMGVPA
jgi:hypothetical protein